MPPKGLNDRTLLRMKLRWFPDAVTIQRVSGNQDENDIYDDPVVFSGRLIEGSRTTFAADNVGQQYDAEVIILGFDSVMEPNDRYKVKVEQFKTAQEKIASGEAVTDSVVKRTRWYDVIAAQRAQDPAGTDIGQVLRCKDGQPIPNV